METVLARLVAEREALAPVDTLEPADLKQHQVAGVRQVAVAPDMAKIQAGLFAADIGKSQFLTVLAAAVAA